MNDAYAEKIVWCADFSFISLMATGSEGTYDLNLTNQIEVKNFAIDNFRTDYYTILLPRISLKSN